MSETMPRVYDQGGDYAVSTLLGTQYGPAALTASVTSPMRRSSTLRADCLAGGYTVSVILHNRAETQFPGRSHQAISMKASRRCWCSAGDGDVDRQGAGFDRVRAFREGVINGAESCLGLPELTLTVGI